MQKLIPCPPPTAAFIDAGLHRSDPESLRSLLSENGYLFVRSLLPADELLRIGKDILALCDRAGWLRPGTDPFEGIVAEGVGPYAESLHPEYDHLYDAIQRLESYHAFPHHPNLMGLLRDLFGEEVLLHPRHIARLIFPKFEKETTPPHQDYIHIQGSKETLTI